MIIAFSFGTLVQPVLEITDNGRDQIVLRMLPYGEEHYTIHRQSDGSFLGTHWGPDKPPSSRDDQMIGAATALGYRNPQRHTKYYNHTPLHKLQNEAGYSLGGRRIDLSSINVRQRYHDRIDHTFSVPSSDFMLETFLSTPENPKSSGIGSVPSILGDIWFEIA